MTSQHRSSLIMTLKSHASGWLVLFSAAFIPGLHLQREGRSSQAESRSEVQVYSPVLQPSETIPNPGTYMLKDLVGRLCIKATMGVEYIVTDKKTSWYFNLDPSRVRINGDCNTVEAVLSLTLPDDSASLQFTFRKEKTFSYVTNLTAHLFPQPVCNGCTKKNYSGSVTHKKFFETSNGKSFKCDSEDLLLVSSELKIKLFPLQIQAFSVPDGRFGEEDECWADFNKRTLPTIIGSVAVGIILCFVLSFLFIRDRRRSGYESLPSHS